jgi:GT2 family glycosyltransferase
VVVTRDREREIVECLRSLAAQDYPNTELIVVDVHSSDGTRDRVRTLFPQARLIALPSQHGISAARNEGARKATGSICLFLDDDARLPDAGATARMVQYFAADPRLACVAFTILDARTGCEELKGIPRLDKRRITADYDCAYFCGAAFAVRRDRFVGVGMFWEPLTYGGQELDLSYRFLEQGYRIVHSAGLTALHASVPGARPRGQWVSFNARDRYWVALRNLPFRYVLTTALLWWAYTAVIALRRAEVGPFLRGFWEGLRALPGVYRERQCVGNGTVAAVRRLGGRLWY